MNFSKPYHSNNDAKKASTYNLIKQFADRKTVLRNLINLYLFLLETALKITTNLEMKTQFVVSSIYVYASIKNHIEEDKKKTKKKMKKASVKGQAKQGKLVELGKTPTEISVGGNKNKTAKRRINGGGLITWLHRVFNTSATEGLIKNYNDKSQFKQMNQLHNKTKRLPAKFGYEDLTENKITVYDFDGLIICQLSEEDLAVFEMVITQMYMQEIGVDTDLANTLIRLAALREVFNKEQSEKLFDGTKKFDPNTLLDILSPDPEVPTEIVNFNITSKSLVVLKDNFDKWVTISNLKKVTLEGIMSAFRSIISTASVTDVDAVREKLNIESDKNYIISIKPKNPKKSLIDVFEDFEDIFTEQVKRGKAGNTIWGRYRDLRNVAKRAKDKKRDINIKKRGMVRELRRGARDKAIERGDPVLEPIEDEEDEEEVDLTGGKKYISGGAFITEEELNHIKTSIHHIKSFDFNHIYWVLDKEVNNMYRIRNSKRKEITKRGSDLCVIFENESSDIWKIDFQSRIETALRSVGVPAAIDQVPAAIDQVPAAIDQVPAAGQESPISTSTSSSSSGKDLKKGLSDLMKKIDSGGIDKVLVDDTIKRMKTSWDRNIQQMVTRDINLIKKKGTTAGNILSDVANPIKSMMLGLDDPKSPYYSKLYSENVSNEYYIYFCVFSIWAAMSKTMIITNLAALPAIGIAGANALVAFIILILIITLVYPQCMLLLYETATGKIPAAKGNEFRYMVILLISYMAYVITITANNCVDDPDPECYAKGMKHGPFAFYNKQLGDEPFENFLEDCKFTKYEAGWWGATVKEEGNCDQVDHILRCAWSGKKATNISWYTWALDYVNSTTRMGQSSLLFVFEQSEIAIPVVAIFGGVCKIYKNLSNNSELQIVYNKLYNDTELEITKMKFVPDEVISRVKNESKEVAKDGGPGGFGNLAVGENLMTNFIQNSNTVLNSSTMTNLKMINVLADIAHGSKNIELMTQQTGFMRQQADTQSQENTRSKADTNSQRKKLTNI